MADVQTAPATEPKTDPATVGAPATLSTKDQTTDPAPKTEPAPFDGGENGKGPFAPSAGEFGEFTFAEGAKPSDEAIASFMAAAKEMNLSQEDAQKFITLSEQLTPETEKAAQAEFEKKTAEFADRARASGLMTAETLGHAKKALSMVDNGDGELSDLLLASGLHGHPGMIRVFAEYGKNRSEGQVVDRTTATDPTSEKDRAKRLFPNSN